MKKLGLFSFAVLVGVAYWYFMVTPPHGGAPQLSRGLRATMTAGALGLEQIHARLEALDGLLKALPPDLRADLPPDLSVEALQARLGFDPTDLEAWRAAGVDPAVGVSVGFDAALHQGGRAAPVILLAVTDAEAALSTLSEASKRPIKRGDQVGDSALITLGERRILMGPRGDLTALYPLRTATDLKAAHEAFNAFLKDEGEPLSGYGFFKRALAERADEGLWIYLNGWAAVKLAEAIKGETLNDDVKFYAERFPAVALHEGGARLLADAAALKALRELFSPPAPPPKLSRFLPNEGGAALRLTLNLRQMFSGLAALFPPSMEVEKGQFLFGVNMLPVMLGVSFEDLEAAFTGHLALAAPLPQIKDGELAPLNPDEVLLLLGAGEPTKADAVIKALMEQAKSKLPPGAVEAVQIKGHAGHRVRLGGESAIIIREGDVFLLARQEARIVAALSQDEPLRGPGAALIDGDAILALTLDTPTLIKRLSAQPGSAALLKRYAEAGALTLSIKLDEQGVEMRSGDLNALMALISGVGVPMYLDGQASERRRQAESRLYRIANSAKFYYNNPKTSEDGQILPQKFPPSVGPSPAKRCVEGRALAQPDPTLWTSEGWTTLDFKVKAPSLFQYSFTSSGEGAEARFTARAVSEPRCDGHASALEISGHIDANGHVQISAPTVARLP
ncbi:hypothetical protein KKF91_15860 [Myxococcota bacterium]|nr:hypothetical protein [Myxococcota bacterium]